MKRIPSILIVDDSPDDCYLAEYVLRKNSRVESVWSINEPQQVLDLYADYKQSVLDRPGEFPPDLVLLDINMPGMTGFELVDKLARRDFVEGELKPVLVCMVTSSTHDEDLKRAESHPMISGYYPKPLTGDDVETLLAEYDAGKASAQRE